MLNLDKRKRRFRKKARDYFGSAFSDHYWVDDAADPARVAALMRRLAPRRAARPLIRLGASGDGGYLAPDDLDGVVACLSPGVSNVASFDQDLAERGVDVIMADASVDGPPSPHPKFHFCKKYIGGARDGDFIRLSDLLSETEFAAPEGDLILQMDIEGAEYHAIIDSEEAFLRRFRIMIVEFHGLQRLFSAGALPFFEAVFAKLLRSHAVVHLHPNNAFRPITRKALSIPPLMEITFYRRDRGVQDAPPEAGLPHPLDAPNTAGADYPLPPCWRLDGRATEGGG